MLCKVIDNPIHLHSVRTPAVRISGEAPIYLPTSG